MIATKKISDEALNFVSGGDAEETADDSRFLNVLLRGQPWHCDRLGEWTVRLGDYDDDIKGSWALVNVNAIIHSGGLFTSGDPNEYYVNGQRVSQEQARQYAMNYMGKHLKRSDWDW